MSDPPPESRRVRAAWPLYLGVTALLLGGIAAVLYFGQASPPVPPPPPAPGDEPLPRTPTELLRDLSAATTAGNRPRLLRLLTDDWAEFARWADGETAALAALKTKAVESVRAAIGDGSARLVADLPDVPAAWPLFAEVDWSAATIPDPSLPLTVEVVAGGATFHGERGTDNCWRLRPGPPNAIDPLRQDVAVALAPLRDTYNQLDELARSRRLSADTFPAALAQVRHLALLTLHPPPKGR